MKYGKRLTGIGFSNALSLLNFVPPQIQAQISPDANSPSCVGEVPAYMSPANLAMMAYQGDLAKQGIPGYQVFVTQYEGGAITAAQIVEAAIKACLLSNKYGVATHQNYLEDLAMQVRVLMQENR